MQKRLLLIILLSTFGTASAGTGPSFDRYFINKTMRLDYFHTGTHDHEIYSYDEIFQEPVWAGSKTMLLDTLNLGKYLFKVYDIKTNELIYSRGFCSLYGEWETTSEASKNIWRTFSESIRFPWPKNKVRITIGTRDKYNVFHEDWDYVIDPAFANIRKNVYFADMPVKKLINHGDPHTKVDIVILPDGYTKGEMKKFRKDAIKLLDLLFKTSPFKEKKTDFNVWAVEIPSKESGIDNPNAGKYVDNILSCSFNSFGSDRYVLTWNNKTIRKAAARAPYEHLYILFNDTKYGGGGIYNLYSTCTSDNRWSGYVFVHEFGHSFGGLGDEYYTSSVAYDGFYETGVEPWDPNVTALLNPDNVKWKDMMEPDTPVPTPWDKEAYDNKSNEYRKERRKLFQSGVSEAELNKQEDDYFEWVHAHLRKQKYWGKVGVFEGSGYVSKGFYRPYLDCQMFTKGNIGFDPVCAQAIVKVINMYNQ